MKRLTLLLFLLIFGSTCLYARTKTFLASELGLNSQNEGTENVLILNQFLDTLSENAVLKFEGGVYDFKFDATHKWIDVISKVARDITFEGKGTTLTMDNQNPELDYYLFRINGNSKLKESKILFKNLIFQGPLNPGVLYEKNRNTLAIYLTGGNVNLELSQCIIKGNFFSGVVATGDGTQILNIENSEIESYGAISAGVFGIGNTKYLHCKNVKFLRSGLPPDSTRAKKEFGAAIYCHPNVSVKVQYCEFYNNHRNAIQFASGKALKYQKFPSQTHGDTEYQLFENNYFDSTCSDAIQLGFYYPHAIIRNNTFYNRMVGVQGLVGATIEDNYFGVPVLKAIEYNLDYSANEDDTIFVNIKGNQVYYGHGFILRNSTKEPKFYQIKSSRNRFMAGGIRLGSSYGGDSCKMVLHSDKDSFFNAGIVVGFDNKATINNAYIKGNNKFLVIPKEADGSEVFIESMYIDNELNDDKTLATIYAANPVYADTNASVIIENVSMKHATNMMYILPNYKNVRVKNTDAQYKKTIESTAHMSNQFYTSYNSYNIGGNNVIENIGFVQGHKNGVYKWEQHVEGELHLKAMDGFSIGDNGNIQVIGRRSIPKDKTLTLRWNRNTSKWDFISIK